MPPGGVSAAAGTIRADKNKKRGPPRISLIPLKDAGCVCHARWQRIATATIILGGVDSRLRESNSRARKSRANHAKKKPPDSHFPLPTSHFQLPGSLACEEQGPSAAANPPKCFCRASLLRRFGASIFAYASAIQGSRFRDRSGDHGRRILLSRPVAPLVLPWPPTSDPFLLPLSPHCPT